MVIFRGNRGEVSMRLDSSKIQNYRANVPNTQAGSTYGTYFERPEIHSNEYPEAGSRTIHLDDNPREPNNKE